MGEEGYPYEIESQWRVLGAIGDVYAVLTDAEALPRWWPAAYSKVAIVAEGDPATGAGQVTDIVTRGVLPYDVTWRLEVLETRAPDLIRVKASGDVTGLGTWRLNESDGAVELSYLWRVRVGKPWMRTFERLLKPVFTWNHNWVMRRGELGLRAELARRTVLPQQPPRS
jgi:uncharacterized protein YndB with AHSA1/START domain